MAIPQVTIDQMQEFRDNGATASTGDERSSPEVEEAMVHQLCAVCGGDVKKDVWDQARKFCSKECRKNRNNKAMSTSATTAAIESKEPMSVRAWHYALGKMCTVIALDYLAQRAYVEVQNGEHTIPDVVEKTRGYLFNAPIDEFFMMGNVFDFKDADGGKIFEGDLLADSKGTAKTRYAVGFNRDEAKLELAVFGKKDGEKIPLTEETAKMYYIVGDVFRTTV